MFGILDRYIGRVIFMSILLCELTLVGLAALIKYVEQLKAVGEGNYDMLNALYYVLLSMPKGEAVLFFPWRPCWWPHRSGPARDQLRAGGDAGGGTLQDQHRHGGAQDRHSPDAAGGADGRVRRTGRQADGG